MAENTLIKDFEQKIAVAEASTSLNQSEQVKIHSCFTPFEKLKAIRLCDMNVPIGYKNRYLVCKVAAEPSVVDGVNILVKDLDDNTKEAVLYNFRYKYDNLDWIAPDTILVIKEPWLQYCSKNGKFFLTIDSPSDVIFVDPADEKFLEKIGATKWYESWPKDAESWWQKANECFKKDDFEKALFLYDRAIRCNPELAVLYLNKSMACLKLGAFYKAYEAAEIGLEKGGDRKEALYRLGQAAYGMREWQKAKLHYEEVLKESPGHTSASAELERTTARLNEQRSGKYDFKAMFLESKKDIPNLDVADYTGPIRKEEIANKGRGIVASEDINEGTLLVVSKAFASGHSHIHQNIKAMEVLQNNPSRGKELYDLYAGDMGRPDREIPFGVIDAARIQQISSKNAFSGHYLDQIDIVNAAKKSKDTHLFTLPSYFNHACLANAFFFFYGDVMIIHAAAKIKKNDEILISYVYPIDDVSSRRKKLNRLWGFKCDCLLCKIDDDDAEEDKKRRKMLEELLEFEKANSPSEVTTNYLKEMLDNIRETYVNRKELQIVLARALSRLAYAHLVTGDTGKCIQYLEEVVTLMGNPLKYPFVLANTRIDLAACYWNQGNDSKFDENIKAAMELKYCTDMDHFKLLYPDYAKMLP